jgi:hypothetical protein
MAYNKALLSNKFAAEHAVINVRNWHKALSQA